MFELLLKKLLTLQNMRPAHTVTQKRVITIRHQRLNVFFFIWHMRNPSSSGLRS